MKRPTINRTKKNKYVQNLCPQLLIDIIKAEYPDRYAELPQNLASMFTEEEWINILTKSRLSYKKLVKLKKRKVGKLKVES